MASLASDPRGLRATLAGLDREQIVALVDAMDERAVMALTHDWEVWARDDQREPPGDWRFWYVKAGRGYGKTRMGSEWVHRAAQRYEWLSLVGPTFDDVREIMVEGESGLLRTAPPWWRPVWVANKRRLDYPNGAKARYYTADEPERLRGKQHQAGWLEEPASWRYPDAWDQFLFGLRLPPDPRAIITGTPKPTRIIRELVVDPACAVTGGTTYDNLANLASHVAGALLGRYEGTRLGRQELLAEILEDDEEAVVPHTWVMACTQGTPRPPGEVLVPVELGVDVGAGGDESVIRERRGPAIGRTWRDRQPDTMRLVGLVLSAVGETRATSVKVDVIGVGKGAYDRLVELRGEGHALMRGVEVVGVNVGERSTAPERFERLRDELWWDIGRRLSEDGAWDLSGADRTTIEQLTAPHYTTTSAGRIRVEPKEETKKRLGRSPDDADALLLAYYRPPRPVTARIRS